MNRPSPDPHTQTYPAATTGAKVRRQGRPRSVSRRLLILVQYINQSDRAGAGILRRAGWGGVASGLGGLWGLWPAPADPVLASSVTGWLLLRTSKSRT